MTKAPLFWLLAAISGIVILTALGPAEKTLGANVRVVYLHGAWVWTALIAFAAAGLVGLAGLIAGRETLNRWSLAIGRAGLTFWITYLPISMWAMQTNWNGLFLAEPRWRLALIFSIGGLVLQVGLSMMDDPAWASAGNVIFLLVLGLALRATENVMHPASPIFGSGAWRIQVYFVALVGLTLLAAWQLARWFFLRDLHRIEQLSISPAD